MVMIPKAVTKIAAIVQKLKDLESEIWSSFMRNRLAVIRAVLNFATLFVGLFSVTANAQNCQTTFGDKKQDFPEVYLHDQILGELILGRHGDAQIEISVVHHQNGSAELFVNGVKSPFVGELIRQGKGLTFTDPHGMHYFVEEAYRNYRHEMLISDENHVIIRASSDVNMVF